MRSRKRMTWILVGGSVWMVGLVAGYVQLLAYSLKPGAVGSTPEELPSVEQAWKTPGRQLVVMALHPRCTCSTASADELSDVLGWTPEAFDLVLLMYVPAKADETWAKPKVPDALERFHPRVVVDPDGLLAESLGARTSGHVLVYDAADNLVFSGGVTPSRAHHGDTVSQQVLRDFLAGRRVGPVSVTTAPVYGCEIQDAPQTALK